MSAALTARQKLFRRLAGRNRLVSGLRLLVPVAGVLIFVALIAQIYISNMASRFGIGDVKISPDSVSIDTPQYSGVLSDGSRYKVTSETARAPILRADQIDLTKADLVINRATGTTMRVKAPEALLDMTRQLVTIDGVANITDSTGTTAQFYKSVFDWSAQTLDSKGPVTVNYADGTTVVAKSLFYDTAAAVWTFSRVTVTLPKTPGAKEP